MNNELYSNNDYRYYSLAHHGILGQKWGRQQGPPYPLDASDHSAAEKKAGWRESISSSIKSIKNSSDGRKLSNDIAKASRTGGKYVAGKNVAAKDPKVQSAAKKYAEESKKIKSQIAKAEDRAFKTEQDEALLLGQKRLSDAQRSNLLKTNKQYAKDVSDSERLRRELKTKCDQEAKNIADSYGIKDKEVIDVISYAIDSESKKH